MLCRHRIDGNRYTNGIRDKDLTLVVAKFRRPTFHSQIRVFCTLYVVR
jgi:hypothetical protein